MDELFWVYLTFCFLWAVFVAWAIFGFISEERKRQELIEENFRRLEEKVIKMKIEELKLLKRGKHGN